MLSEVSFTNSHFWLRVYDVAFGRRHPNMTRAIGDALVASLNMMTRIHWAGLQSMGESSS